MREPFFQSNCVQDPIGVGKLSDRRFWAALFLIALFACAVRFFHFHISMGSDDQRYVIAAREIGGHPRTHLELLYRARILWLLVLRAWGAVPGVTLESASVLMFLCSVASVVLVGLIAAKLWGNTSGLWAAVIHASYPINVLYDTKVLPDSLAVPLMLVAVLLFILSLQKHSVPYACAGAFLAGACFPVKEYFLLVGVAYLGCLLLAPGVRPWGPKTLRLVTLAFVAGISLDFWFHAVTGGTPVTHVLALAGYGKSLKGPFTSHPAQMVRERLVYIRWLLTDYGVVGGWVMLAGLLALVRRAWRQHDSRAVFLVASILLLGSFLSFAPASFNPLRFVEQQARYAMVFLPFMAMGAGGVLSIATGSIVTAHVRRVTLVAAASLVLWNAWVPNYRQDLYLTLTFVGLHSVLMDLAATHEVQTLVLPHGWAERVPDSYLRIGPRIRYARVGRAKRFGDVRLSANEDSAARFFVPIAVGKSGISRIDAVLANAGFTRESVDVPTTSLGMWLHHYRPGWLERKRVAWLYVRSSNE